MKNLHLIPINVIDIVDKMNSQDIRDSELANYVFRLEAIRDYCDNAIKKAHQKKFIYPVKKRNISK